MDSNGLLLLPAVRRRSSRCSSSASSRAEPQEVRDERSATAAPCCAGRRSGRRCRRPPDGGRRARRAPRAGRAGDRRPGTRRRPAGPAARPGSPGRGSTLGTGLLTLLSRDTLDDATWDEVEETLLSADLGVAPDGPARRPAARRACGSRASQRPERPRGCCARSCSRSSDPTVDRALPPARRRRPGRGPRGRASTAPGKTTTTGKLARAAGRRRPHGRCSGRPTRSAPRRPSSSQTWGERVGAEVVRGPEGGDPASVAFDAVTAGRRARRRRRDHRHRRPPAHQGRPDGRARQGQAGHREAAPGRRGAARARRHDRPERPAAGAGVRRGRRRHGHRADQARRHGQGRHRRRGPARARRPGQAGRPGGGRRRPGAVRRRRRSSTRCSAAERAPHRAAAFT